MSIEDILKFWVPFFVAMVSLLINIAQLIGYRRVRNKISVWAKDAKSMTTSIIGVQQNIKKKKLTTISGVSSNIETLGNFANSMFVSMEEELGRTKREIKLPVVKRGANSNNSK